MFYDILVHEEVHNTKKTQNDLHNFSDSKVLMQFVAF